MPQSAAAENTSFLAVLCGTVRTGSQLHANCYLKVCEWWFICLISASEAQHATHCALHHHDQLCPAQAGVQVEVKQLEAEPRLVLW